MLDKIESFFKKSKVKFQNDLPNEIYLEGIEELNLWSIDLYKEFVKNKNPLEVVAIALDFLVKRQESKQMLIRRCFEIDTIMENSKKPVIVVGGEGDANA